MKEQDERRGYMFPWDEVAYEDIEEVVDLWLDDPHPVERREVEEYTARDRRSHLPTAEWLVEMIEELAWENEAGENVQFGSGPKVLALAERLMQTMADEGSGWMCGEMVATHVLELRGRQPFVDGEPWGDPLPEEAS